MKKKSYVIIGLGTFGSSIARELAAKGEQVLVIDKDEEKVQEIIDAVTQAIVADATDEKSLKSLDIADTDYAIVSIGDNMEASIMITLLLKELGVKNIIAKGLNQLHGKVLARVGADRIVFPESEMAEKLVHSLLSPNILEEIYLSSDYNMIELVAPKKFIGKNLKDIDLRAKYNVILIGKKTHVPVVTDEGESDWEETLSIAPNPDEEINEGDVLIVIGSNEKLNKLKEEK
ncbi:MAG: TrkA family potassium uptake protein [bacterium]